MPIELPVLANPIFELQGDDYQYRAEGTFFEPADSIEGKRYELGLERQSSHARGLSDIPVLTIDECLQWNSDDALYSPLSPMRRRRPRGPKLYGGN